MTFISGCFRSCSKNSLISLFHSWSKSWSLTTRSKSSSVVLLCALDQEQSDIRPAFLVSPVSWVVRDLKRVNISPGAKWGRFERRGRVTQYFELVKNIDVKVTKSLTAHQGNDKSHSQSEWLLSLERKLLCVRTLVRDEDMFSSQHLEKKTIESGSKVLSARRQWNCQEHLVTCDHKDFHILSMNRILMWRWPSLSPCTDNVAPTRGLDSFYPNLKTCHFRTLGV